MPHYPIIYVLFLIETNGLTLTISFAYISGIHNWHFSLEKKSLCHLAGGSKTLVKPDINSIERTVPSESNRAEPSRANKHNTHFCMLRRKNTTGVDSFLSYFGLSFSPASHLPSLLASLLYFSHIVLSLIFSASHPSLSPSSHLKFSVLQLFFLALYIFFSNFHACGLAFRHVEWNLDGHGVISGLCSRM